MWFPCLLSPPPLLNLSALSLPTLFFHITCSKPQFLCPWNIKWLCSWYLLGFFLRDGVEMELTQDPKIATAEDICKLKPWGHSLCPPGGSRCTHMNPAQGLSCFLIPRIKEGKFTVPPVYAAAKCPWDRFVKVTPRALQCHLVSGTMSSPFHRTEGGWSLESLKNFNPMLGDEAWAGDQCVCFGVIRNRSSSCC